MSTRIPALAFVITLIATLSACGGGGGAGSGGGGIVRPDVPFTSFAARQPDQTLVMSGISQTASGTETAAGMVTSLTLNIVDDSNSNTAKLTYDANVSLIGLNISTPQSSVSFASPADTIDCSRFGGTSCGAVNPTAFAVVINPFAPENGWNYQTFGVWEKLTSATAFEWGAISVGNATPGSAIPPTGPANFIGVASGFLTDASGTPFTTAAGMTANADFGNRNIAFATINTQLGNLNTGAITLDAGYNLSGTLSYAAGINQFSGTVSTANTAMTGLTGSATGRFYGPAAEEIGGVYSLTSTTGPSRMLGGFGGKR